jgi:hypothetical protein
MAVQCNTLLVLANDGDGSVVSVVAKDGLRAADMLNLRNRVVVIVLVCGNWIAIGVDCLQAAETLTSIFID